MRVLSTIHVDNVTHALVIKTSGAPIAMKQDVLQGNFEILDLASLEDSPPLPVAGISAQSSDADFSDVAQPSPHVKGLAYPEGRPALLKLFAQH